MARVHVTKPRLYRRRFRGGEPVPPPPALLSNQYAVWIQGLTETVWVDGQCTDGGASPATNRYEVPALCTSGLNNTWHQLSSSSVNLDAPATMNEYFTTSCTGTPTLTYEKWRFRIQSNGGSSLLVTPGTGVSTTGTGTYLDVPAKPGLILAGEAWAASVKNTDPAPLFGLQWGYNGWAFIARGPLTSEQVQTYFDSLTPP